VSCDAQDQLIGCQSGTMTEECTLCLTWQCVMFAGTNFLTRSVAFEQAGWSPEYTLTEDYALGMELRKRKWKCRYVEEYLAVGEAPEQVRNCFQQRSRWAKVRALPK
jgi:cellulose synthase/poly-beta-1,6-N-acetylglucosamine synthase-like glycosyltransferase